MGQNASMKTKSAIMAVVCLVPGMCAGDVIDEALSLAGLTKETAGFDEGIIRLYSFDEFTLPSFRTIESNPWRGLRFFETVKHSIALTHPDPAALLMSTRPWTGDATRRDLLGSMTARWEAEAKRPNALDNALRRIGVTAVPSMSDVPESVREAAALILLASIDSKPYYDAAFAGVGDLQQAIQSDLASPAGPFGTIERLRLLRGTDLRFLYTAAADLLAACKTASEWVKDVRFQENYKFEVDTSWGRVTLSGGRSDIYGSGDHLLIIDTSGDDIYLGGARGRPSCWFSAIIDTQGTDTYISEQADLDGPIDKRQSRSQHKTLGPASAHFGIAVLIDLQGDDLYRSVERSQGSARFGVAVLLDEAGDDGYESYVDSQGFAYCGAGFLIDLAGDDYYSGFNQVQGCGLVRGIGILADSKGNDIYIANDEIIEFPSPQSAEHNVSMAQGAGYGVRADYTDGHSLGGGIGILFDGGGNDTYRCGVFGQGVGYWQGIGAIFDISGNDEYHGVWYVQGASAHFAIGYLEDAAGNDKYTATMNMAQGAGHDFSVGYLIDRSGDDTYKAPNLSLGAGNANGIGIFIDYAGDDHYEANGTTLGRVNPTDGGLRTMAFALGLFIDGDGNDKFPEGLEWVGNSKRNVQWGRREERVADSQIGIFLSK